jgi:hypothetical protein
MSHYPIDRRPAYVLQLFSGAYSATNAYGLQEPWGTNDGAAWLDEQISAAVALGYRVFVLWFPTGVPRGRNMGFGHPESMPAPLWSALCGVTTKHAAKGIKFIAYHGFPLTDPKSREGWIDTARPPFPNLQSASHRDSLRRFFLPYIEAGVREFCGDTASGAVWHATRLNELLSFWGGRYWVEALPSIKRADGTFQLDTASLKRVPAMCEHRFVKFAWNATMSAAQIPADAECMFWAHYGNPAGGYPLTTLDEVRRLIAQGWTPASMNGHLAREIIAAAAPVTTSNRPTTAVA